MQIYFKGARELRAWFEKNHDKASELHLGYYKKGTGKPSVTWRESVDQALCFGWIDSVRRSIDQERYVIRFTPRRPGSTWSAVNVRRADALAAAGLMHPAGLRAFSLGDEEKSAIYSAERETAKLPAAYSRRFKASAAAWRFFKAQPAGYRRLATGWVVSAKRQATRERRLAALIEHSTAARRLPQYPSRSPSTQETVSAVSSTRSRPASIHQESDAALNSSSAAPAASAARRARSRR